MLVTIAQADGDIAQYSMAIAGIMLICVVKGMVSKKILFERIKNANVSAVLIGDKIDFNTVNKTTARIGEDGIIEING